jgi:GDP-D-mannose 3',5'-epimerase
MKMKGKHLVTGAAGMIGSHLVKRLIKDGYEVVAVDNLSSGSTKNLSDMWRQFEFIEGDCRDTELCKTLARGKDYIWSLAANMGGIGYITTVGADIMHDNAIINLNMLRAAIECGVSHYFYSSSACVYPEYRQNDPNVTALKESDAFPAEPDQFYGWEKLFTEKTCEAYVRDYSLNARITRFHNVYGPAFTAFAQEKAKAPCHLILKAIKHPEPEFTIWGDGKQTRSFLYIQDCLDGMLALMSSNYDRPVNIGSDRLISINDLAELIIKISGKEIKPRHDLTKPQGVRGRNSDNTLVKQALGWQPKVSLEVGLRETYQWAVEHFTELEGT